MDLDRFCNFVWYMITRNGSEQEVERLRSRLWQPPAGTTLAINDPRSPWSAENEKNALSAFKRGMGGV